MERGSNEFLLTLIKADTPMSILVEAQEYKKALEEKWWDTEGLEWATWYVKIATNGDQRDKRDKEFDEEDGVEIEIAR